MKRRPSLTLGICLAAGLTAGIGLARPGVSNAGAEQPAAAQSAGGYGASASDQQPADGQATPAPNQAAAPPAAIEIAGFAFGDPLTVAPGSLIEVTNSDGAPHTVTATDGAFDTGNLGGGQAGAITAPTEPGTYAFFCSIHPSMQGTLTVAG